MTIEQVIKSAKGIKPNSFNNETITMWINEVEGMVQTDVMLLSLADVITYNYDDHKNTELLVKTPHDKIYVYFVVAMIDFANNEYNLYTNTLQLFNKYFADYTRWYALRINPANGRANIEGYYLSAYALALKHGYTGTEEEWVASLKGERGEQGHGWIVSGFVQTANDLPGLGATWNGIYIKEGVVFGVGAKEPYEFYVMAITDDGSHRWIYQGPFSPILAQSWAVGNTGYREGENTDNAKYYSKQAQKHADEAAEKILAQTTAAIEKIDNEEEEAIDNFDRNANDALEEIANSVAEAERNAQDASGSARIAEGETILAQSWAVGGTGSREGEDRDNAKYYSAETKRMRDDTFEMALEAESWAAGGTGTREGEDTDNAMYYSEEAKKHATASKNSAEVSTDNANLAIQAKSDAEGYAKEAKKEAESIDSALYCNALKGTATGIGAVRIDDVSPMPHEINVSLEIVNIINQDEFFASTNSYTLPTEVGKTYKFSYIPKEGVSLSTSISEINKNGKYTYSFENNSATITIKDGYRYTWDFAVGTPSELYESVSMVLADVSNVSIKSYGKNLIKYNKEVNRGDWGTTSTSSGSTRYVYELNLPNVSHKMTLSLGGDLGGIIRLDWSVDGGATWNDDGNMVLTRPKETFDRIVNARYRIWATIGGADSITNIQVELGGTATDFEEYESVVGAVSKYPTTTLVSDTNGVKITAEYNRDINKAFAELEEAIANI